MNRTGAADRRGRWRSRTVPTVAVRAIVVVVACAAFAMLPRGYALLAVGLAVLGALLPTSLAAWGAALVIGLAQLTHPATLTDWRVYAAVAVVHALHVVAGWTLVLPVRGRLRPRVLWPSLRRWLVIQVPAQAAVAGALALQMLPVRPAVPAGAMAVAAAGCAVVIVILLRVLAARR